MNNNQEDIKITVEEQEESIKKKFLYLISIKPNSDHEYLFFTSKGSLMVWDDEDKVKQIIKSIGLQDFSKSNQAFLLKLPIDSHKGLEDFNLDFIIKEWLVTDLESGSLPFKSISIFRNNLFLEIESNKINHLKEQISPLIVY